MVVQNHVVNHMSVNVNQKIKQQASMQDIMQMVVPACFASLSSYSVMGRTASVDARAQHPVRHANDSVKQENAYDPADAMRLVKTPMPAYA